MQTWAIQQCQGCAIHVLAMLGGGVDFTYAYTGFVCAPKTEAMEYPRLERFHHIRADFDSTDAAISAGMSEGCAIAERWCSLAPEVNVARS